MAKAFAKSFYDSAAWQSARDSYISERISIDGGACERCHTEQGYIVHHKIWLNKHNISDPNVTLNHKNLEYLCKNCHDLEHYEQLNGRKKPKLQCFFDVSGQPMPPIPR